MKIISVFFLFINGYIQGVSAFNVQNSTPQGSAPTDDRCQYVGESQYDACTVQMIAQSDCDECLMAYILSQEEQSNPAVDIVSSLALPLAMVGSSWITAHHSLQAAKMHYRTYENVYKIWPDKCENMWDSYQTYMANEMADYIRPGEMTDFIKSCPSPNMAGFPGMGGGGGLGGGIFGMGNGFIGAGYSPGFLSGMMGPYASGGIGVPGIHASGSIGIPGIHASGSIGIPGIHASGSIGIPGMNASGHLGIPGIHASGHAGVPGMHANACLGGPCPPGMNIYGPTGIPGMNASGHLGIPGIHASGHVGVPGMNASGHLGIPGIHASGHVGVPGIHASGHIGVPGMYANGYHAGLQGYGPGVNGGMNSYFQNTGGWNQEAYMERLRQQQEERASYLKWQAERQKEYLERLERERARQESNARIYKDLYEQYDSARHNLHDHVRTSGGAGYGSAPYAPANLSFSFGM